MINIDGSYLEGGGQIIRTALTLSLITGKSFRIINVRQNRKNPGLKEQHFQAINSVAQLCNAKHNAKLHANEFEFIPEEIIHKDEIKIQIRTAGSTALLMSVLLPLVYIIKKPLKIKITGGGTWNKFAPPVLYLQKVILPLIKDAGIEAEIKIIKDGFFPKGGAESELILFPWKDKTSINLEKHDIEKIKIYSIATKSLENAKVAERQIKGIIDSLKNTSLKIEKEIKYVDSFSNGSGILITTSPTLLGTDFPGERGVSAEKIGREAALKLIFELKQKSAVDKNAADQLMIYMALSGGKIKTSRITNHIKTNAKIIEMFLSVKFEMDEKRGIVECQKINPA